LAQGRGCTPAKRSWKGDSRDLTEGFRGSPGTGAPTVPPKRSPFLDLESKPFLTDTPRPFHTQLLSAWGEHPIVPQAFPAILLLSAKGTRQARPANTFNGTETPMRRNRSVFIVAVVATIYFGVAGNLQAVPPPPPPVSVPDGGSTGLLLGVVLGGLGLLKWKLTK